MILAKLIAWLIIAYGLTNIVVFGKIFKSTRDWFQSKTKYVVMNYIYGMITCAMCFSFWAGIFLSFLLNSQSEELFVNTHNLYWFFDGLLSSGGVWLINSIVEWFEENRPSNKQIL